MFAPETCAEHRGRSTRSERSSDGHESRRWREGAQHRGTPRSHAAVDLEADVVAGLVDHLSRFARLVERRGNERLAAEARVHGHEEDDVDLVHDVLEDVQRGGRVEDEAALAARRADELERAVDLCVSRHDAIDATLRRRNKRGATPPGGT